MTIKKIASLVPAVLFAFAAAAQDSDFGIWYSAGAKAGVTQKLDAEIAAELRTFMDAGKVEQGFLEGGVEYNFTDWLSAGPVYRLILALEDDDRYHYEHEFFFDIKSSFDAGSFTFQGRYRFQTRVRTYREWVEDKYPDFTSRLRLKVTLRTKNFPLNPYIYAETFIPMNKEPDSFIDKNRYGAGTEYKISKKHAFDLIYIFQKANNSSPSTEHIMNLGYNFSF